MQSEVLARLKAIIADAEADMAEHFSDAKETGERADLADAEVCLLVDDAKAIVAALSAAEPQPAPSVAIKPLEWSGPTLQSDGCHVAKTIFGTYSAVNEDGWYVTLDDHPWGQGFEWSAPDMRMTFDDAAKAARADYETRILSALSAQVQDVAVRKLEIAENAMRSTIMSGSIWKLEEALEEMEIIDLSDAAPAKQEGKP